MTEGPLAPAIFDQHVDRQLGSFARGTLTERGYRLTNGPAVERRPQHPFRWSSSSIAPALLRDVLAERGAEPAGDSMRRVADDPVALGGTLVDGLG